MAKKTAPKGRKVKKATKPTERKAKPSPRKMPSPKKATLTPSKAKAARIVGAEGEVRAPVVSMGVVNELVKKLTALTNKAGVDLSYDIGNLVVQDLFEGDVELLHKTGPKAKSLRQLLSHPRLPFNASSLTRAIKTYEILVRSPFLREMEQLGVSHFAVVQSLPPAQQDRLLTQAAEKGWTVRVLAEKAAKLREGEKGSLPGRPALPAGLKAIHQMQRALRQEGEKLPDAAFVEKLDDDGLLAVHEELIEVQEWCAQVAALLKKRLTVVQGEGADTQEVEVVAESESQPRVKILVFEGELAFASVLTSELERRGVAVRVFEDGKEGLETATNEPPDLILLTIELHPMNGFAVCNRLKKDPVLKDVPLIILSSKATEETFEQHKKLRVHADAYLRKPVAVDRILGQIRQFVAVGEPRKS